MNSAFLNSYDFFILSNTLYSFIRLWGMGQGLRRGLGINAQVTTPGGLGFRRGLLGGSFSPGVLPSHYKTLQPHRLSTSLPQPFTPPTRTRYPHLIPAQRDEGPPTR
ncbi:hypothetical protein HanIR_Chr12g0595921 [Helianthus annuus]|nr:hypothetical protein HanIR_Chr12g0595921 [Helianthus annuus]